jgi:hypothetical protein
MCPTLTTAGSGQLVFANMIFLEAISTNNFSVHKKKVLLILSIITSSNCGRIFYQETKISG